MPIKDYIEQKKDYIIQMRRYFHAHPEVSLKEINTCKVIQEELSKMGIDSEYVEDAGVYATITGTKKQDSTTIAFRADIDALSMQDLKDVPYKSQNDGVCHACGHDGHTAVLLATAKILKEKQNEFSGTIKLFFQQAEEVGKGARVFIKKGYLKDVSRVLGFHVSNNIYSPKVALTPGPQNASVDYFKITIHGKGAHVSQPHLGTDALYIASQIVVNLQSIVSRNTDPLDTVLVGVGTLHAGTQYNIIAEHATIEGTTRAFTKKSREFTNQRVIDIAKKIGKLYHADIEVFIEDGTGPLINNEMVCQEASEIMKDIIGQENILTDFEKTLAGDNFADFQEVVPGAYAFVGTRNDLIPGSDASQHHGSFDIDEESLLRACNLFVDYSLWYLNTKGSQN